ncbi:MAG: twin-arginine translocase TatA/TatE family subunit [bacterium]|jgi:sec-independent protein translocase protein TatA|nr:twin-arginine translocase TatA/TatE family subunit [Chloroflexota bacterium]NBO52325.1 twin-arginine translocase TatA/TatE family subunit [Candidatus Aquidulcis sp.]
MPNVGFPELILILAVVLLVFGPGKLPEIGKAVGNSFREFKEATSGSAPNSVAPRARKPTKRATTSRSKRKA